jgi:hypothetical protein
MDAGTIVLSIFSVIGAVALLRRYPSVVCICAVWLCVVAAMQILGAKAVLLVCVFISGAVVLCVWYSRRPTPRIPVPSPATAGPQRMGGGAVRNRNRHHSYPPPDLETKSAEAVASTDHEWKEAPAGILLHRRKVKVNRAARRHMPDRQKDKDDGKGACDDEGPAVPGAGCRARQAPPSHFPPRVLSPEAVQVAEQKLIDRVVDLAQRASKMLHPAQAKALDDIEDELKCSIWCATKPLPPHPMHRTPSYSLSRP